MARVTIPIFSLIILFFCLAGGGCDSESAGDAPVRRDDNKEASTYDITVKWQIEGDYECVGLLKGDAVPFDKITIGLYESESDGETKKVEFIDNVGCSTFEYTIARLPSGNYDLVIQGWATYDDTQLPFYEATNQILVGDKMEEDATSLSLSKGKGQVSIGWGFDNYLQCEANDVSEVVITIVDEEIEQALDPIIEKCDIGRYEAEGLRWSTYSISVAGYQLEAEEADWEGESPNNPIEVKPGELIDAAVVMSPAQ